MSLNCICENKSSQTDSNTVDLGPINEILANYDAENTNLITLLQHVQAAYNFLPEAALKGSLKLQA